MGAQESAIRSKDPIFEFGDPQDEGSGIYKVWDLVTDCKKSKKYAGTLFSTKSLEYGLYYENGIKYLKQLRHPGVLVFLEKLPNTSEITLATERVQVLDACIDHMSFLEVQSGLFQILKTLNFLHEKAKICHNNITPWSIFVTNHGEWKLGGFEVAQPLAESNDRFLKSAFYKKVKCVRFLPPEDHLNEPGVRRDIYAFGRLIDYSLAKFTNDSYVDEKVTQSLRSVSARMTDILNTEDLASQLDAYAFSNDLIKITDFLGTIQIKSQEEKEEFFQTVVEKLRGIPSEVVARRLPRLVMARFVIVEPLSHIYLYPTLLLPKYDNSNGILPVDLFETHMIPEIVRVFAVKEVPVRLGLLAHFSLYAKHIPEKTLDKFVREEIIRGYHDTDDRLVAASLRAFADMVDILGASRIVEWDLTKSFASGTSKVSKEPPTNSSRPKKEVLAKEPSKGPFLNTSELNNGYTRTSPKHENYSKEEPEEEEEEEEGKIENNWDDDDWGDNWNVQSSYQSSEFLQEPDTPPPTSKINGLGTEKRLDTEQKANPPIPSNVPKPAAQKTNSIGAIYEIKPLPTTEDDIFAEMAPKIKIGQNLIDKLTELQEKEKAERQKQLLNKAHSSKFAMVVETNLNIDAWNDDEDSVDPNAEGSTDSPDVSMPTAKSLFTSLQ